MQLDDLYRMVALIYSEQNAQRSPAATFAHFVEVCGMLTIHDRQKKREGLSIEDALCKALGWYFPLLAKFKVSSVEELIFRKYPYVCPYCRSAPHSDINCKTVRGTASTVDHDAVKSQYEANRTRCPRGLNAWQTMFQDIYPRTVATSQSCVGLLEELGEMAEAVRVFDRYPKYFAGEAADVFSYLMGIANEHSIRCAMNNQTFDFEGEFVARYPGLCVQCGYQVCVCPAVPEATVGRMAKELELSAVDDLFQLDPNEMAAQAATISQTVIEKAGGYAGLLSRYPLDRGEANRALVLLCLTLAEAVADQNGDVAKRLRSAAVRAGSELTEAGTRQHSLKIEEIVASVRAVWPEIAPLVSDAAMVTSPLAPPIASLLIHWKVLLVMAGPSTADPLRLQEEERTLREAIRLAKHGERIEVTTLPAARIDDFRRALLRDSYSIIHFAGHGGSGSLLFEKDDGSELATATDAVAAHIEEHHASVRCVILNACYSTIGLTKAIAPVTIGMNAAVGDVAAIEFVRGFYDAIGAGRSVFQAIEEGKSNVRLKGLQDECPIQVLTK